MNCSWLLRTKKTEGIIDLANFVLNENSKNLNGLVTQTWKMESLLAPSFRENI